jgi:hypothetical protein
MIIQNLISRVHNHRGHQRHAVTLIEVLMSTLVISLGIMGLLALIPLGNHLANRGLEADRVSSLGQRIYREARTRGALNPDNWIDRFNSDVSDPDPGKRRRNTIRQKGEFLPARQAYLIDPTYFVTTDTNNTRNEFPSQTDVTNSSAAFSPYNIQMRRITLSTLPAGGLYLEPAQANLAFASSDQLAFERPKATDDPLTNSPRQMFYQDSSTNNIKRQIQRPFSWMIMLVPEPLYGFSENLPLATNTITNNTNNISEASTDQFNASTIIMRNRNMIDGPGSIDRGEHVFNVTGASFGEVTLSMPDPSSNLDLEQAEDIMDLARGRWICLTRNNRIPNTASPVSQSNVYHWYRIQSADEVVQNGTSYEINLSIQGPDWQYSQPPTQAIYVRSVVGVYERKVRLESLSKWTP